MVAMSGGVDSSVAALLLKEQGCEVVGVTMCLGIKEGDDEKPRCCGVEAIEDAKRVCRKLKIPHYVLNFSKELEKRIVNKFISEYLGGKTPNPCIDCNRYIKFGTLLKKTIAMGFDFLATGHYAKIEKNESSYVLKVPKDRAKDQTYFLYPIKNDTLQHILFPLAELAKEEVKAIARSKDLSVAEKPESQDICFVSQNDYRKFLLTRIKEPTPGPIVNRDGEVLGEHRGIAFYTIGQREGLGISFTCPLYVTFIDVDKNQIVVGKKKDLQAREFTVGDLNLLTEELPREILVKIRYAHKGAKGDIFLEKDKAKVVFAEEQEAITPGQAAVFYNNDVVLGGGVIEKVLDGYN